MKDKIRINSSITKYLLLAGLIMITFTTNRCKEETNTTYYCEVVINSPSTTVFNENESITFSAHIYAWIDNHDTHVREPRMKGVRWESNIDGTISTQNYDTAKEKDDHSFTTNNLSVGNHNIKCYTIDVDGNNSCSDEIYIEIQARKQIDYLHFEFDLDEAEYKWTYSNGADPYYSKRVSHGLTSKCGTSSIFENVYTTIIDKDKCSSLTGGQMTVTFLDDPRRVNVHAEWIFDLVDIGCSRNIIVDYEGIPFKGPNGTASDLYYESGSSVSRINISRYEIYCTYENGNYDTIELLNTNCGEDAEISVYVYYQR